MKHVEDVRKAVELGQVFALGRLRSWLASKGDNQEALDKLINDLNGETKEQRTKGDLFRARVTDFIMRELGHETNASVEDPNSMVRRAVRRVR